MTIGYYRFNDAAMTARRIDLEPGDVIAPAAVDAPHMVSERGLALILGRIQALHAPQPGETAEQAALRAGATLAAIPDVDAAIVAFGYSLTADQPAP